MLTTHDNLLFFHLLDDGLQDKLLHHLSRDGGEADRPVVSWPWKKQFLMALVLLRLYVRDERALGCQCLLIVQGVISSSRNGNKAPNSSSKAHYSGLPTAFF